MKSEHDEIKKRLHGYLRGTLTKDAAAMVEDHLLRCDECAEDYDRKHERHLKSLLAGLPPHLHLSVVLTVYKGLSMSETAAVMGCSEGAVKANYHSAIKKLSAGMPCIASTQGIDL
ncbi:MAG: sigma-70 family RNA polymerase sigma factor [Nitrospirae bacterium]|nr:sigma-70 family RNA polymerase sigma factor [Nitrospirota bacterium]